MNQPKIYSHTVRGAYTARADLFYADLEAFYFSS